MIYKVGKWVKIGKGKASDGKKYNTIDGSPKVCRMVYVANPTFCHNSGYNKV